MLRIAKDPELHTLLIGRQRLWDCLRNHVPDEVIIDRRMVSRVSYTRDQRPFIEFDDGPPGLEADLVVGADGAKSTVKSITGNGKIDEHPAVFESAPP